MQEIRNSNPPVVTRICDSNNSWARHHRSLKLYCKYSVVYLSYLNLLDYLKFQKQSKNKVFVQAKEHEKKFTFKFNTQRAINVSVNETNTGITFY